MREVVEVALAVVAVQHVRVVGEVRLEDVEIAVEIVVPDARCPCRPAPARLRSARRRARAPPRGTCRRAGCGTASSASNRRRRRCPASHRCRSRRRPPSSDMRRAAVRRRTRRLTSVNVPSPLLRNSCTNRWAARADRNSPARPSSCSPGSRRASAASRASYSGRSRRTDRDGRRGRSPPTCSPTRSACRAWRSPAFSVTSVNVPSPLLRYSTFWP